MTSKKTKRNYKKYSKKTYSRVLFMKYISLFLFFLHISTSMVSANTLTGGISRIRLDDYTILVRGGIIQSVRDHTINIWLNDLDAEIRIGKKPSYFVTEKEVTLPQLHLPKKISLSLPPLPPDETLPSPASLSEDNLNERQSTEASEDNQLPEVNKAFILNVMNTNSLRAFVEGNAEIYQPPDSLDTPELQEDPVVQEKKGQESNQITLRAPFPQGEETSQIRISTRYPKKDYFRFVVMGDSKDGLDIYKTILRKVRNIRPLFFAHLGDIVGSGTRREYQQILRLMSQVNFPFFVSIGNNDAFSQGQTVYQYWLGPTYFSFNYRNSHFVFLDDASGVIDENQFRWLREDLLINKSKKIFLFLHIPPYDPRQARSYEIAASQNAGWLMDIANEFGIKRIYSSHINSYYKFTRQGIPIVITGGAGSRLNDKKSYHHFLLVTIKGDTILERIVRVD